MKLIIGLGNPGKSYEKTRHNAGAWFLEALAQSHHTNLKLEKKFSAFFAQTTIDQHHCYLAIPTTFMNLSGESVQAAMDFYKINPNELLIAHDDLDLPVGSVRLKFGGGHGGHNGLRDIIAQLQTPDFYRLRLGIGHPGDSDLVTDYVLNNPSKTDAEQIHAAITKALTVMPPILNNNIEQAMQMLHTNQ